VAAYGDLDELNAALGAAHARLVSWHDLRQRIEDIQAVLFGIGAELATPDAMARKKLTGLVRGEDVETLEASIDAMEKELPSLRSFILPGGGPAGAQLHVARTVCRRAERKVVALGAEGEIRSEILLYLNRLSDWLFVVARYVNHRERHTEIPWSGDSPRGASGDD
jgi:cob(I)alamin adenosyltransferase